MIEMLFLLIMIFGCGLVIYDQFGPVRYTRGERHPWLLYGSNGSVKVDFAHPSMRKRIIEACEAVGRIRRAKR